MFLHKESYRWAGSDATYQHRQCPLPKCSFLVRFRHWRLELDLPELDALQQHLLDSHDAEGRKRFASLLAHRGYHYETADVLCPVCPEINVFKTHAELKTHIVGSHFGCFRQTNAGEWTPYKSEGFFGEAFWYRDANVPGGWRVYKASPSELHEHRRTILSLWPVFSEFPVWADIKECSGARNL